jgi:hypothetical protein
MNLAWLVLSVGTSGGRSAVNGHPPIGFDVVWEGLNSRHEDTIQTRLMTPIGCSTFARVGASNVVVNMTYRRLVSGSQPPGRSRLEYAYVGFRAGRTGRVEFLRDGDRVSLWTGEDGLSRQGVGRCAVLSPEAGGGMLNDSDLGWSVRGRNGTGRGRGAPMQAP